MHSNVLKCASGGVLVQEYPLLTSGGGPRMCGSPVTSDQVCSTWGLSSQLRHTSVMTRIKVSVTA